MRLLPSRQVHLDFHTSEHIGGIASKFDKEQFQQALKLGHVNGICVFGKCHHGYFYYPTQVGTSHPGLEPGRDLAGEMMDACHEIGIYAPLYLTFGWSHLDSKEHPEWNARKKDGTFCGARDYDFNAKPTDPKPESAWIHLCTAGGYRQYLYDMTEEACRRYKQLDGLFFDICFWNELCYCDHCRKGMQEAGVDIDDPAAVKAYADTQKRITVEGLNAIVHAHHPDATIFYNTGGAAIEKPQWHFAGTYFELEDLPTVWGGYDKLPVRARYFSGTGKECMATTGKFHRAWGEFGGFKTKEALRYECAAIFAYGARAKVGDQLHPNGKMDLETYRNIGYAYSYIEQIEDYCLDTAETAKLGLLVGTNSTICNATAKLLLDSQIDFDIVCKDGDFTKYDTIIIPETFRMDEVDAAEMDAFVKQGGKVMILGGGGLKRNADEFAFDVPFTYEGKSEYDMDFFQLAEETEGIVSSPVLCYRSAHKVSGKGEVHSYVYEPYFSRTYEKFCSHYNTPYKEEKALYPGAIQCGNVMYVAHELGSLYVNYGATYHRRYFAWLLRKLYNADSMIAELPSQGRIHFVKREQTKQYMAHLLYASPVRRGEVEILEDFPTLYNIPLKIQVPEEVISARLIPQGTELEMEKCGQWLQLTVPQLQSHQMVVFEYKD